MTPTPANTANLAVRFPLGLFALGSLGVRSVNEPDGIAAELVRSRF